MGKTAFAITGSTAGQDAKVNITSPAINTAHLPISLPLNKSVELKGVEITAAIKGQQIHLNDLSFQLFEGEVKGQGNLISGSNSAPFTGKAMIQDLQLGPALDALAATQLSISGTAAADLALQGHGLSMPDLTKSLEGTSHITVKDGKIEGVNLLQEAISLLKVAGLSLDNPKATVFSTIETDLAIKEGVVNVQRLVMDSHEFQAMGSGTIGFDQTLNLKLTLTPSQDFSQKIISSSPAIRFALNEGRLDVPFLIKGTMQVPSYGLDSKALEGKVQEQVKGKLKEATNELLKGSAKPDDVKQKGRDLLKGFLK